MLWTRIAFRRENGVGDSVSPCLIPKLGSISIAWILDLNENPISVFRKGKITDVHSIQIRNFSKNFFLSKRLVLSNALPKSIDIQVLATG